MNRKIAVLVMVVFLAITTIIGGCLSGNTTSPPPAPSGGGCGVSSSGFSGQQALGAFSKDVDCSIAR